MVVWRAVTIAVIGLALGGTALAQSDEQKQKNTRHQKHTFARTTAPSDGHKQRRRFLIQGLSGNISRLQPTLQSRFAEE
jgi:hypothetical protein